MKGERYKRILASILFFFLSAALPLCAQEEEVLTLSEVVRQVLAVHPLTQAAQARVEAMLETVRQTRAYPNPIFTFTHSDFSRERTYSLSQPLEWPFKRTYRIGVAKVEEQIAESDQEKMRQDLIATARAAFLNVLLAQEQSHVAEAFVETANQLRRSTDKLFQEGDIAEFEVIKARVEAMRAEKDLEKTYGQVETARASLNLLLGKEADPSLPLAGSLLQLPVVSPLEEFFTLAEEKNPLLTTQRQTLEREKLNLKLAWASLMPDLAIDVVRGEDLQAGIVGPGVSVVFSFPLWDRKEGAIAAARGKVVEAEATLRATRLQVHQALLIAYHNWEVAKGQVEAFMQGLIVQAEEAAVLAQRSYREGEGDLLGVLDAERGFLTVRRDYVQTLFERQMAWVALEQAAGIGTAE